MKLKTLLPFVMVALSISAHAQDMIYRKNGETISAFIKEINNRTITFKRADNSDGPSYTIEKKDIEKIVYQNGSEDVFEGSVSSQAQEESRASRRQKIAYKNNVVALAPFQFTESGVGISLSYERSLDKDGIASFYVPFVLTFSANNQDGYNNNNQTHIDPTFYAMPGIKIYPTGNKGKVKYAIGPSLVAAAGQKTSYNYDYNGMAIATEQQRVFLGVLVQNYLNINPSPHLFMSVELGLGSTYINLYDNNTHSTAFLAEGAFKIGYRF